MGQKILITTSSFGASGSNGLENLKAEGFAVTPNPFKRKLSKAEVLQLLPGHVGVLAGLETLDREVLTSSALKVISRVGSGKSNIDLQAAKELGISVHTTPEAPVNAVAELTVGMMLATCRFAHEMNQALHQGEWKKMVGFELKNKNIIIIGFGNIGQRVAALLQPFGANILIVDPFVKTVPDNLKMTALENALPVADVVTIHASGEDELLGSKEFATLKKGVVLLNPARGGIINETLLMKALDEKIVAAAWLDTFQEEPYQGPLTKYPQALLTPHIGSYSHECRRDMEDQAVQNLIKALKGTGQ